MDSTNTLPLPDAAGLLAGKVALIIGASRGIGAATARSFAAAGATVVVAARDEQALAAVASEIAAGGGRALAVPADIGDEAAVQGLVARTVASFGRLDVAFNNAADGPRPAPLAEIAVEEFDHAIRVNVRGFFLATKFEIPAMLAAGGGAIVNMASTAGLSGVRGIAAYVASKHAIIGMTKTAALDYARQNIRVNVVAPGPILSDRIKALPDAAREQIGAAVPMHRIGLPEEVGATVTWLCSEQGSFITGATITIDGGRLAGAA